MKKWSILYLLLLFGCVLPENIKYKDYRKKISHHHAECTSDNRVCVLSVDVFKGFKYCEIDDIISAGKYRIMLTDTSMYSDGGEDGNFMKRSVYIVNKKYKNISNVSKENKPTFIVDKNSGEKYIDVKKGDWIYFIPQKKNEIGYIDIQNVIELNKK